MDNRLNMIHQCGLAARKANSLLDSNKQSTASILRERTVTFYSALIRSQLE